MSRVRSRPINASNHLHSLVPAKISTKPSGKPARPAAERLIEAAAEVFARDGLSSATTREIARTAGVNEVTLFRNFQTKQNLLAAVLEKAFENKANPQAERFAALPADASLAEIVTTFAEADFANMTCHISLLRVLVGEIHRFQEHEMKVLRAIFRPRRERMIERLITAQQRGQAREDIDPAIIVDQLVAMIFMGVLRFEGPICLEYKPDAYLRSCIQTILRSIEIPAPAKRSKAR